MVRREAPAGRHLVPCRKAETPKSTNLLDDEPAPVRRDAPPVSIMAVPARPRFRHHAGGGLGAGSVTHHCPVFALAAASAPSPQAFRSSTRPRRRRRRPCGPSFARCPSVGSRCCVALISNRSTAPRTPAWADHCLAAPCFFPCANPVAHDHPAPNRRRPPRRANFRRRYPASTSNASTARAAPGRHAQVRRCDRGRHRPPTAHSQSARGSWTTGTPRNESRDQPQPGPHLPLRRPGHELTRVAEPSPPTSARLWSPEPPCSSRVPPLRPATGPVAPPCTMAARRNAQFPAGPVFPRRRQPLPPPAQPSPLIRRPRQTSLQLRSARLAGAEPSPRTSKASPAPNWTHSILSNGPYQRPIFTP